MNEKIPKGPGLADLTVIKPASMTDVIRTVEVNEDLVKIQSIIEEYKKIPTMAYFLSNYSKLQYNNKKEDSIVKLLSNINKSGSNDVLVENKLIELRDIINTTTGADYADQILLAFCLTYLAENISNNKITNK